MNSSFVEPYDGGEILWGLILLAVIVLVNGAVLGVITASRELWKPRHLWIACLCLTDLLVGCHKALELLLLVVPRRELCVLGRATLGIPYVLSMIILTCVSLDRLLAVQWPFFYAAHVCNKHVLVGFILVLLGGSGLAAISVTQALGETFCRTQRVQLIALSVVLSLCSVLTLVFNSTVLHVARRQLGAIYASTPLASNGRSKTTSNNASRKMSSTTNSTFAFCFPSFWRKHKDVPLITLPCQLSSGSGRDTHHLLIVIPPNDNDPNEELMNSDPDNSPPPVRTQSLPTLCPPEPEMLHAGISEKSPCLPKTFSPGLLSVSTCTDVPLDSNADLREAVRTARAIVDGNLPRTRSLLSCGETRPMGRSTLLRHMDMKRGQLTTIRRLFPSIRFARTVLLIMIPMWIFIVPIIVIIPLERSCETGHAHAVDCDLVSRLYVYLNLHLRSVLPLQAILDTAIYALISKEFRMAFKKLIQGRKIRRK